MTNGNRLANFTFGGQKVLNAIALSCNILQVVSFV